MQPRVFVGTRYSYPRDKRTRSTSLRRAGLEDKSLWQSCCPRHAEVSASSLRRAGLQGRRSYPRDGLIRATSVPRAGLEGMHSCPRDGPVMWATPLRRAFLEGQSCCPRHVQVSASSWRCAGLEGKHTLTRVQDDSDTVWQPLSRQSKRATSCHHRHCDALVSRASTATLEMIS